MQHTIFYNDGMLIRKVGSTYTTNEGLRDGTFLVFKYLLSGVTHVNPHPLWQHFLGNVHSWSCVQLLTHIPADPVGVSPVGTTGQYPGLGTDREVDKKKITI